MQAVATLPHITIELGGVPIERAALLTLARLRVQQRLGLPTLCELIFNNPPDDLPVDALTPGASLNVRIDGYDATLFEGDLTAIEELFTADGQRELRLRGYDPLHRLRKRWSIRAHSNVTPVELARTLAGELGLPIDAPDVGTTWPQVIQFEQSDFELLTEALEQVGLYAVVQGDRLRFLPLAGDGAPLPLRLGETLLEAHFELNADAACRSVTVTGWNPWRAEVHQGQAGDPRRGYELSAALSAGGDGQQEIPDLATISDDHLTGVAQAVLDHRAAREVVFRGVANGDPALRPGARVAVTEAGAHFNGQYALTAVTHTIDAERGYIAELSTYPPPRLPPARRATVTLGSVSSVADGDDLGRVRVTLPAYRDIETEWLQVLSAGAGSGKGFSILPDVGDRVLVLFTHDLPSLGIILGGLWGTEGPVESGVRGDSVSGFILRTPGGQRVRLDDHDKSLLFETEDGNLVELAPAQLRVHATTDLDIAAPGRRITIRARQIDFERA